MDQQFDELTKSLVRSVTRHGALEKFGFGVAALALITSFLVPSGGTASPLGPLIELSRPNAVGTCDTGFSGPPATWTLDDTLEPFMAVNPVNPKNIVVVWIQGLLQDIIAATTFDGGRTWQRVPVPFTTCSGGPYLGAGDERLCFAPNGDLYAISVVGMDMPTRGVAVCKSTDGGLHWSAPITLAGPKGLIPADIAVITADPVDSRYLYAIWDGSDSGHRGPAVFSRTTDGGRTWEPARVIVQTTPQDYVQFSQLRVLPDGTVVDIYQLVDVKDSGHGIQQSQSLQVIRSADRGQTWSSPIHAVTMLPLYGGSQGNNLTTDPDTGQLVQDVDNQSVAGDSHGNLYAVWGDGRFSNFQYNDIAFSMSADGGFTWSVPIRVNQTPLKIPTADRQAFLPAIAVTATGTIGVTYYDFRFNDANPGAPTDYWLARCQPASTLAPANPANWGNEIRLTDSSFDLESCGTIVGSFYLGDYFGLDTVGSDFVCAFTQVDRDSVTSIFFRRIGK